VQWLHELGLVHRDIKEDNFLVHLSDNHIIVRIADLGLAQNPGTYPFEMARDANYPCW
jgi:serine/threonine protein kinase